MVCNQCGAALTEGTRFCHACGSAQPEPPKQHFCGSCGAVMEPGSLFCVHCGNQTNQAPAPAAPATPTTPAAPPPRVAPPVAPVASGAAAMGTQVAAAAAVGAAKAGMSVGKKLLIFTMVLGLLVGAFSAYVAVFVGSPEDTTREFFDAAQSLDFDSMLSCMDPGTEKQIRAMLNLTGSLMGSLTGIDLDLEALASLAPSLVPFVDMDQQIQILSVETMLYSDDSINALFQQIAHMSQAELEAFLEEHNQSNGNYMSSNAVTEFLSKNNLIIPGIAKLTAKSALVKAEVRMNGDTETLYLPMQNEGFGDWRIYLNLNLLAGLPSY